MSWDAFLNKMLPPLSNGYKARVSSSTGPRNTGIPGASKWHRGIDCVYTKPSPPNIYPVYCPVNGTVTKIGTIGNVCVRDINGYSHEFLHMKKFQVKVGQKIEQYTIVGYMSNTGAPGGVHVHYQLRNKSGTPVDPRNYWNGGPEVLLYADGPQQTKNRALHDAIDQGFNVRQEPLGADAEGTLYEFQGRQAGKALPADVAYALWTNRVPEHEPWARTMMVDTDKINKETDQHDYNTSHNQQLDPESDVGAKLIGKLEGDEYITRGPFWRR